MNITEVRLKQIITEEVELRLIKQTITEVVGDMQLDLTEEQRLILEASVLDAIKSAAKKAAIPIAVMAVLAFGSEIGANLQDLEGVGMSPSAAEQIHNAVEAGQNMTDSRLGQAQAGSGYLVYVPYDSLPDGYKDTFTGGAEKEDLKKFYQTMDIQSLADKVKDFNSWGSQGHGNFYDTEVGQLLPASWSIAYKALQDKHDDRASKGKSLFKENA